MARPPGQKREPILDSALQAFVESGFHGSTMPRIARGAGVSPATCYLYFDSKEALANELFRRCLKSAVAATRSGLEAEPGVHGFMTMWRGMLHFGREHSLCYRFLSRALYAEYLDAESRTMLDDVGRSELASFERYRSAGLIGPLSLVEIRALVRGHARVLVEMAAGDQLSLTDEVIDRSGQMTWAGLISTALNPSERTPVS